MGDGGPGRGEAPPGCCPGNEFGDPGADRTSGGRGENGLCPGAGSPGGVNPVEPLAILLSIPAAISLADTGLVAAAFNRLVNFSNRERPPRASSH